MCCKWDGCNSDINSARLSKVQYEQYLLQQILGSEYDHFISPNFDQTSDGDNGEATKEQPGNQISSSSSQKSNKSDNANRRIGIFHSGGLDKKYQRPIQQAAIKESNIFSNGFPKYFVPKVQVGINFYFLWSHTEL